jgi:hypothetical protein
MAGRNHTVAVGGAISIPPPGWARITDRIVARLRARSLDERLLNGGITEASPAVLVRRARLLHRRHRLAVASGLRRLVAAARGSDRNMFAAQLPIRAGQILESEPLILTLADELEHEKGVSPRGVILADRLLTDGASPIYPPTPMDDAAEATVETAVKHARAALHLG